MSSTTTAEPKQFTLKDDGYIYFQQDASNPLPGDPIAQLLRGGHALSPVIRPLDSLGLDETAAAVVPEKLNTWFYLHCVKVMEPLVKMKPIEGENLPPPVAQICARLYDELGIVPRADVAEAIEGLDADMRKMLRARHVRLGPVLVFVPDLTKPAAVRLRAILWALYHNKPLPAPVPKDGAVSAVIETEGADPAFYQAIGYPLYGNRVIRIDMLDRVMGAVYDNVKDNQFQARHQMAEWLGCSIPDLYTVLESMGHKKVHDPAEVKAAAGEDLAAAVIPSESSPKETSAEESTPAPELPAASSEDIPAEVKAEEGADSSAPAPAHAPKPELATFRVWWPRRAGGEEKKERVRRAPKKTPPPIEKLTEEELKAIEDVLNMPFSDPDGIAK